MIYAQTGTFVKRGDSFTMDGFPNLAAGEKNGSILQRGPVPVPGLPDEMVVLDWERGDTARSVRADIHTHTHTLTHTQINRQTDTRTHAHTHTRTHAHAHTHAHTQCTHTHTCTHARMHTCTQTHTRTQTETRPIVH